MTVITRFPPSPTGFMHIGNARTALFNYLYARHMGGKFLMRIEDTDRARHSEEAVQVIKDSLKWMGLTYDNEPVSQFANKDRHIEVAKDLLARGAAYECYCTPEELDKMREAARAENRQNWYDRRWRDAAPDTPKPKDVSPVIRIKAPLDGSQTIDDQVQGKVTVQNDQLDDFILLRSDGTPTYMLAVVVDDHDMGVTHVIRGDDHLNNTFRQMVIYNALGWDKPVYAHLPLILGQDGAKLSKRHGAQSVDDLRQMGYLPEAVNNYLMRLGWSHGDDEIISMDQAIDWFDIKDINKGAAKFDFAKLNATNAHYMKQADNKRLLTLLEDFAPKPLTDIHKTRLLTAMDELKGRSDTLPGLVEDARIYLQDAPFDYDEKAQALLDEDGKAILKKLMEQLETLAPSPSTAAPSLPSPRRGEGDPSEMRGSGEGENIFTAHNIEQICRDLAKTYAESKLGKVMMPLRAALTGTNVSPSLFHAIEIIGKEQACARIQNAIG